LLFLASEDLDKDINIYINSPRRGHCFMSAQEANEYGIISDTIVSSSGQSAANDCRLELAAAGGGKPEPAPEPEREGPKTSP
jgi:hypothetical protein